MAARRCCGWTFSQTSGKTAANLHMTFSVSLYSYRDYRKALSVILLDDQMDRSVIISLVRRAKRLFTKVLLLFFARLLSVDYDDESVSILFLFHWESFECIFRAISDLWCLLVVARRHRIFTSRDELWDFSMCHSRVHRQFPCFCFCYLVLSSNTNQWVL